jgi:predicted ATPase/class 3 adenylate cyclase/DNA-binding CsgD family transcriptional regulator
MGLSLPSGTVTFLLTDIEGSTLLWRQDSAGMEVAFARHRDLLKAAIGAHGGYVFQIIGDAFCAAFATPAEALLAALAAQRSLLEEAWGLARPIQVRMALHSGTALVQAGDYTSGEYRSGITLSRAARLLSAAHGGQIILSRAAYELLRDHLPDEVALLDQGEHRLKDLSYPEHIYQASAPGLASDFPPLRTLDRRQNNLPVQPTGFLARERELGALKVLLGAERLVTLTGPGGTGKTRLGLQVAADMLEDFQDGVYFVALDRLVDPALVVSAVAQALGVVESGARPLLESVKAFLQHKAVLLVLDNFEHVLDAAPIVADLLAASLELKVLATSREALRLRAEHEFAVPPLAVPDLRETTSVDQLTQFAAVQLFIQRARAAQPDFSVDNHNAAAVAELCVLLDGLPLAVELAAARIKLLPPQALLSRLKGATSSLGLLTGGARDLPARQQTLRATIQWSHDLLDGSEQTLFRRLAVFPGGADQASVEAIYRLLEPAEGQRDVFEALSSLTEKNLLRHQPDASGEPRYRLLHMIREFAWERLKASCEDEAVQRAQAAHCLALAEQARPELDGARQREWLDRFELEHDNLRAALHWAVAADAQTGLRLAGVLSFFWLHRSHFQEGQRWLEQLLARHGHQSDGLTAEALLGLARLAQARGDIGAARDHLERCLVIRRALGDPRGTAETLARLGIAANNQGDRDYARALLSESLGLCRESGDRAGTALALDGLAAIASFQGLQTEAIQMLEEGLALCQDHGPSALVVNILRDLGMALLFQGKHSRAQAVLKEGLRLAQHIGSKSGVAAMLGNLGATYFVQGDLDQCGEYARQALAIEIEIGDENSITNSLDGFAYVAAGRDQPRRAARLWSAVETLQAKTGWPRHPGEVAFYAQALARAKSLTDPETFAAAWAEGRRLLLHERDRLLAYAVETDTSPEAELGGPGARAGRPAGLTAREAEILRLLAQGLSDAAIAEKLVISPRTVNAHLTSIYAKLGVNSRAAATRFANANGLT